MWVINLVRESRGSRIWIQEIEASRDKVPLRKFGAAKVSPGEKGGCETREGLTIVVDWSGVQRTMNFKGGKVSCRGLLGR